MRASATERSQQSASSALHTTLRVVRRLARGLGAVLGEGAYPAYVAHHREAHPGVAPLDERTFWRERYRAQDMEPGGRCC